jgi:sirohydrochlorin ferrochelatase
LSAANDVHLLVVAHGSRRAASNEEVKAVVDRLRVAQGGAFASIEAAFLELAEPSIEDGLTRLAERGARRIVVMPYFLAAGSHVSQDIPEILDAFRTAHPDIHLTLKHHIGSAEGMGRLILDMALA